MRSTYILIEQYELHNFLHELGVLHSWARNMASLSTSMTFPTPLGASVGRPGPRYYADERAMPSNPFTSSTWNTASSPEYYTAHPAPKPQAFQHSQNLNQHFDGVGQGYGGFEYREPTPMRHARPRPRDAGRQGAGQMGMCGSPPRFEARTRAAWSVPMQSGPHRTPVITRAPNNPHTPQRGAMFVRRPRRARPQRNAENAEVMGDGTEYENEEEDEDDEEYVEEDNQGVDHEGEAR